MNRNGPGSGDLVRYSTEAIATPCKPIEPNYATEAYSLCTREETPLYDTTSSCEPDVVWSSGSEKKYRRLNSKHNANGTYTTPSASVNDLVRQLGGQRLENGKNVPFDPSPPNLIDQWMESPEELEGMKLVTVASNVKSITGTKRQCQDETPIITSSKCHRTVLGPIRKILMQSDGNRRSTPPTPSLKTPGKSAVAEKGNTHHGGKENQADAGERTRERGVSIATLDRRMETPRKSEVSHRDGGSICRRLENKHVSSTVLENSGIDRRKDVSGQPRKHDRDHFQSPYPTLSMISKHGQQARGIAYAKHTSNAKTSTEHVRNHAHTNIVHARPNMHTNKPQSYQNTHTLMHDRSRDEYTPSIGASPSESYTQSAVPSQSWSKARSQSQPDLHGGATHVDTLAKLHSQARRLQSGSDPDAPFASPSQPFLPNVGVSQTHVVSTKSIPDGIGASQSHMRVHTAGSSIPCTPKHKHKQHRSTTVVVPPDTAMRETLRQKKDAALRRRGAISNSQLTKAPQTVHNVWRSQSNPEMNVNVRGATDSNARTTSAERPLSINSTITPNGMQGSSVINSLIAGSGLHSSSQAHTATTIEQVNPKLDSQAPNTNAFTAGSGVQSQTSVATTGSYSQLRQSQTKSIPSDIHHRGSGVVAVQPSPNTALKIALKQKKAAAIRRRKQAEKMRRQKQTSQTHAISASGFPLSSQSSSCHGDQRGSSAAQLRMGNSQQDSSQR